MRKARKQKPKYKLLEAKADRLAREACVSAAKCMACGTPVWFDRHLSDGINPEDWEDPCPSDLRKIRVILNCSGRFEWCHLVSRGVRSLRHDPENCVCLCNIHHRFFTQQPAAFTAFMESINPGVWERLAMKQWGGKKEPLENIYQRWIDYYEGRQ